jgi:cytochrome b6-f complex iron-sulfur subunit
MGSIRFFIPRVLYEESPVIKLGFINDLVIDVDYVSNQACQVFEHWKDDHSVWIVRAGQHIYALQSKCTHLGCTPNWFPEEGVFKCPCHGSQFKSNGDNFAGPAPRPLDRVKIYADSRGSIFIDKSKVYTSGKFDKPGAYLEI